MVDEEIVRALIRLEKKIDKVMTLHLVLENRVLRLELQDLWASRNQNKKEGKKHEVQT